MGGGGRSEYDWAFLKFFLNKATNVLDPGFQIFR
jgi:hypothetical protein